MDPRNWTHSTSLGLSRRNCPPLQPLADRIHLGLPVQPGMTRNPTLSGSSRIRSKGEKNHPKSKSSTISLRLDIPYVSSSDPKLRVKSPRIRSAALPKTRGPLTITFSDDVDTKRTRSMSSALPTSRRSDLPNYASASNQTTTSYRTQKTHTNDASPRTAQGHKFHPSSHGMSSSTGHIDSRAATTEDFYCHRREIHATVSSLGTRIGGLENMIAAALPTVAEARLLWMETTVIKAPTKLATTHHALCEYCEYTSLPPICPSERLSGSIYRWESKIPNIYSESSRASPVFEVDLR